MSVSVHSSLLLWCTAWYF